MCLGQCFEKGACAKTLNGDIRISGDGLRLEHRSPGKKEYRSFFKGDAKWTVSGGKYHVTESHNIEIVALRELMTGHGSLGNLSRACRKSLRNPHIYDSLVKGRISAMIRRGWVKVSSSIIGYNITPEGIKAFASAAGKRLGI